MKLLYFMVQSDTISQWVVREQSSVIVLRLASTTVLHAWDLTKILSVSWSQKHFATLLSCITMLLEDDRAYSQSILHIGLRITSGTSSMVALFTCICDTPLQWSLWLNFCWNLPWLLSVSSIKNLHRGRRWYSTFSVRYRATRQAAVCKAGVGSSN